MLQADLTPFLNRERSTLRILSEDRQRRWLTFAVGSDREDEVFYLLNRATRELKVLAEAPLAGYRDHLALMEPVTFRARDGLLVHGLLAVPPGKYGPQPLVLLVHGGPWAQDHWGFQPTVQFLINRGYAVLQVNYRGSTGYGRDFLLAGTREFARKMHDDLIDGVRWAVERGTADGKRVAIMGASYGGYSALSGAAFTPDVFAAAVDRVGIADMVSLIEDWPRYWRVGDMGFWSRFFGDPRKPEERKPAGRALPAQSRRRNPRAAVDRARRQRCPGAARPFGPHGCRVARSQPQRGVSAVCRRGPRPQPHHQPDRVHARGGAISRPSSRRPGRRRRA